MQEFDKELEELDELIELINQLQEVAEDLKARLVSKLFDLENTLPED